MSTKYRSKLGVLYAVELGAADIERIEELADFTVLREGLRDALRALPRGQAEAVWLRVGLDLPYPSVAERLGCSLGAARVRVTRGLSALQERLQLP